MIYIYIGVLYLYMQFIRSYESRLHVGQQLIAYFIVSVITRYAGDVIVIVLYGITWPGLPTSSRAVCRPTTTMATVVYSRCSGALFVSHY